MSEAENEPDLNSTASKQTAFSKYRSSSSHISKSPSDLGEQQNNQNNQASVTDLSSTLSQNFEKQLFKAIPELENTEIHKPINVYNDNLAKSFKKIRKLSRKFNYISVNFTHPGTLASCGKRPEWDRIQTNVSLTTPIQVSLALYDDNCNFGGVWQFNFQYSLGTEMYREDTLASLKKAKIGFDRLEEMGVKPQNFAEILICSGILLNKQIHWVSYHSGYTFGMMLQLLRSDMIPFEEAEFFKLIKLYFPNLYDIRYVASKKCNNTLASQLFFEKTKIESVDISQSYKNCQKFAPTFFRIKSILTAQNSFDTLSFNGYIYGLGAASIEMPKTIQPFGNPENIVRQRSIQKEIKIIPQSIDDLKLPAGIRIVNPDKLTAKVSNGEIAVNA